MAGENKVLVIDSNLRTIKIPTGMTNVGVAGDKGVTRLYFQMPRFYGGFDLSAFDVSINYFNAANQGDVYVPNDAVMDDRDTIIFSWLLDEFMTAYVGKVRFSVHLEKKKDRVVEKEFNTTYAESRVLEALNPMGQIAKTYPSIVEKWKEELFGRFAGKIDSTLRFSGMAADAQVTGSKIKKLEHSISSPFNFKGSRNHASLPSSAMVNDTYYCPDKKCRYTWNGSGWYQSSMNESDYADELIVLSENMKDIRKYGYMAEGELIIDVVNRTIAAKNLLLLTSDRSFEYVRTESTPTSFGHTGTSLSSIFAVKNLDTGSYAIYMGDEAFMNTFEVTYYICGYYSKKIVGSGFSPNLKVTINGVTYKAREVTYNDDFGDILSMFDSMDVAIAATNDERLDVVYRSESQKHPFVEISADKLNVVNGSIESSGRPDGSSPNRLSTTNIIPAYNSCMVELYFEGDRKYAAFPHLFDENKEYQNGVGYYTSYKGVLKIPLDTPYFKIQISGTDNADISPSELKKIRLISKPNSMNVTTLEMISEMLMSEGTTRIKLLGDSITQGMGATGYVGYTVTENGKNISVRGNGPDAPNKAANYVEGDFLGEDGSRRWYESTSSNGWANKLKRYFESKFDCVVKNYGMSGIDSGNLLGMCSNLVYGDDDVVILMIGTNDRATCEKGDFETNVTVFVHHMINLNKKVVLMASLPASVSNETAQDYHMEDVSTILRKIAYSTGVAFISLYDEILDYCDDKDIYVDSLLNDGLHPNDSGYDIMFKIISKNLGVSIKRSDATW